MRPAQKSIRQNEVLWKIYEWRDKSVEELIDIIMGGKEDPDIISSYNESMRLNGYGIYESSRTEERYREEDRPPSLNQPVETLFTIPIDRKKIFTNIDAGSKE